MNNRRDGPRGNAAIRPGSAVAGGTASTSSSARTAAARAPSGGLLMAGPLSGHHQYAGVVRLRTPHPHDVLCGRGGSINSHPGNIRFRDWVKVRKQAYNVATSKVTKARMCREVFHMVRNLDPPGRFLQRMENDQVSGMGGMGGMGGGCWWMEINEQKALAKTSQALREGAPKIRQASKTTDGPPRPVERKRSGGTRGTKRKAAAKEPPAKRAKRASSADSRTQDTNAGETLQLTPTSSSVALETAAEVARSRSGMPHLPFYNAPAPVYTRNENVPEAPGGAPLSTAGQDNDITSAPVTPGMEFALAAPPPVSPMFLSPIGNGSIPPELNPPALSLGDPSRPISTHYLPPLSGTRLKRSHSLENHELEAGGGMAMAPFGDFQDPFQDESHILSGRAFQSPRPSPVEGNQQAPDNVGEQHHSMNTTTRSVAGEKKVHNIIEHDHDQDHDSDVEHYSDQQSGENCFCLCGTPGNQCICSDLADHLLHRSDGLEELNLQ